MKCPKCGKDTAIIDVSEDNTITLVCGHSHNIKGGMS